MRRSASEVLHNLENRIARLEKQSTHYDGDLYCPDCYHTPLEALGGGYYFCEKCGHQPHVSELDTSGKKASTIRPSFVSNRESVLRFFEDKITPIIAGMGLGESLNRNLVSIRVTSSEDRFNFLVSFNHQEFSFSHEFPEQIAFSYLFVSDSDGRVVSSTRKSGKAIDLNEFMRHWDLYDSRRKGDHVKVSINLS